MRTIILGGTGFIGRALAARLVAEGHEVIVPSRRPEKVAAIFNRTAPGTVGVSFDGRTGQGWAHLLGPDTAIVNLAGENIAEGRWTEDKKHRILTSRLNAGAAIIDALRRTAESGIRPAATLIQASAVGYYGPRGAEPVDENDPSGSGFLAEVARKWEASTSEAESLGVRRAVIRTSMVLGPGGALMKMLPFFRLGLGGPLGSGKQAVPWIHLDDEVGAILFLLGAPGSSAGLAGPFNLAAPETATSRSFAHALGRVLHRPAFLPAPGLALRLILGEMAQEVLLSGVQAVPSRLLAAGYQFHQPRLDAALRQCIAGITTSGMHP